MFPIVFSIIIVVHAIKTYKLNGVIVRQAQITEHILVTSTGLIVNTLHTHIRSSIIGLIKAPQKRWNYLAWND